MLDEQIKKLMKEHPDLFPTEAKVWQYIRGSLRRSLWMRSPMRNRYKASQMEPPPKNYKGRGKRGARCAITGEWTMASQLEVDHKIGNVPLRSEKDVLPFIVHLLATGDDLQLLSKEAHKIKSYAERMNISFEEAKARKQVIAFKKLSLIEMNRRLSRHKMKAKTKKEAVEIFEKLLESAENRR